MIYTLIGKLVVKAGRALVIYRYGRQLRVALGVFLVGAGIAAYLAARDVPEG